MSVLWKAKSSGSELNIGWAVCGICGKPFDLDRSTEDESEESEPEPKPKRNTNVPRYGDVDVGRGPQAWPVKYERK